MRNEPTSVTREHIQRGLEEVGLRSGDVVMVHSSLSAFGHVQGGAETVIDALLATVGATGTVIMPTFTWGDFHRRERVTFDVRRTPCETGRIPELFRQRPDAVRSEHVCHSVAAIGPHAAAVLGVGVSAWGRGSSFEQLCELDAWNLLLGVGFRACTALHRAEELAQVPYRAYRDFSGSTVIRADGTSRPCRSVEFLRVGEVRNDFGKMESGFEKRGVLRTTRVGQARLINARMRTIVKLALEGLRDDPYDLTDRATVE